MELINNLFNWGLHGNFWTFVGLFCILYIFAETACNVAKYLFLIIGIMLLRKNSKIAEALAKVYAVEILSNIANQVEANQGESNSSENEKKENQE